MAEIKKMGYCVNGEWKESTADLSYATTTFTELFSRRRFCTRWVTEKLRKIFVRHNYRKNGAV